MPGLQGHAILVGYGRVGSTIAAALRRHNLPLVLVEEDRHVADRARADALPVIWGDAAREEVLQAARPRQARLLILALPGAYEARQVMALVRAVNPTIEVAVRTHDDDEIAWLRQEGGVGLAVMGEREVALGMADFALQRLGVPASTAQATVDVLRARMPGEAAA
ncbi:NAD-binding protein [Roseomonas sp. 18066]|uniref:NAD-binding protein n=1 Tax=Roseomonas sp. 18066 TaxID=2681412 RepID=UPI001358547A|nr:NAD-binding protein [Roseomonas sp. 18066]